MGKVPKILNAHIAATNLEAKKLSDLKLAAGKAKLQGDADLLEARSNLMSAIQSYEEEKTILEGLRVNIHSYSVAEIVNQEDKVADANELVKSFKKAIKRMEDILKADFAEEDFVEPIVDPSV